VSYVAGETPTTGTVDVLGTVNGFAANEYLMISDCAGTDIFRTTAVTTSGGNTQVSHGTAGNTQPTLSRRYGADAVVMAFASHTYFVADTGRQNAAGQSVSGLYRFDGSTAQELVDGVEDMQIEYALDTDGDRVVDAFRDAGAMTAANWGEIMAIRISLLMNSVEGASAVVAPYTYYPASSQPIVPPSGDYRLRQEFSSLVSVRNAVF
jgi:type IV pilus assembly protein PilW